MTITDTMTPANPAPADALRAATARIAAIEHDLAEARAALAVAENALATGTRPVAAPDAYTIDQVAHTLGLSKSKVAEMVRRGDIHSVKLGGCRRVFRQDLDDYIAAARGHAS